MDDRGESMRRVVVDQAAHWYVEHRAGALDARQKREFMRWLRASPQHVSEYLSIAGVAHDAEKVSADDVTTIEALLAPLARSGNVRQLPAGGMRTSGAVDACAAEARFNTTAWLGAAFAATLAVAVVVGWVGHGADEQRFVTGAGEERTFTLEDDTVVHMNTDSTLVVRFDERRRLVEMREGEAMFTVGVEARRPFQVLAGDAVLEDVGTAFNVLRLPKTTVVTVLDGEVGVWSARALDASTDVRLFSGARNQALALLRAGEQTTVTKSSEEVATSQADLRKTMAWLRQEIVFDGDTIAAVAEQFNRYNRIKLRVTDERIGAVPIAGVFNSRDVVSFAQFLDGLPGVNTARRGDELIVDAEPTAPR